LQARCPRKEKLPIGQEICHKPAFSIRKMTTRPHGGGAGRRQIA
jgi:hypothetical protein